MAGRREVAEAIRAGVATEVRVATESRATAGLRDVLDAARDAGLRVVGSSRGELDALAADHHGVVALVETPRDLGERDLERWPFDEDTVVVVLDGITDPQNLGAAARSAEAAGAAMLVTRLRRAAKVTSAAIAASAGALLHLPHARVANIPRSLRRLQDVGFTVVGLADDAPLGIYDRSCPDGRVAIVVGSEGSGLSRLVRETCDLLVALPMHGRVGSLNASASLAAALYAYVLPRRSGGPARR